ncbi:MAG: UDP-N-acetylmuramate--L-alanine ligase [Holosporales bacterium]|jgi:UDP-N-acetylmuramate--alanine ligase|nr:UDP-N-acetylmuramate--L-alanine ligase [Holosporales bacterium]
MFASIENNNMRIHFIGLGGIGMSGIAEIMHSLGYIVQGSDISYSPNIERLEKIGIKAFIGHSSENIHDVDVVVFSSAIKSDNPELMRAKELKIPCLPRAIMLSQIVRFKKSVVVAGSHGKTMVTSICATILEMAAFDPTIVNGGIINSYKTNAKLGKGEWTVIESDESDGSFIQFSPTIGIVTNVDKEHILHYEESFDNLKVAFKTFLSGIPFYGVGIVCIDDDNVENIVRDITDRRIVTYGIDKDATIMAINIERTTTGSSFDVRHGNDVYGNFSIPLMGDHNIRNSLAAIAMALELKVDLEIVKAALASFSGVNRRFTPIGNIEGAIVIDDYAHHPTEISALLQSARQRTDRRILIVCQPHRFTRLNLLFSEFCECFDGADGIIVVPVYKADDSLSEIDLNSEDLLNSQDLFVILRARAKNVFYADNKRMVERILEEIAKNYGIILFAGAGDISKIAREIVAKLGSQT